MSSYLEIAEEILDRARKPLTPREILARAYAARLMPHHLYGRTQHKTIQARLSEDILKKKDGSAFFRPQPGQYFLRKYIEDTSLPADYRTPIVARRRTRDLFKGPALAISNDLVEGKLAGHRLPRDFNLLQEIPLKSWCYVDPRHVPEHLALVWSTAVVVRGASVLSYRTGRYRDDRDTFANKQTISFTSLVTDDALSLFDQRDFGIQETALKSAVTDLDIPIRATEQHRSQLNSELRVFIKTRDSLLNKAAIALVIIYCPKWFEPTKRRLSLNNLRWIDAHSLPNNIEDYDPWSGLTP